VRERCARNPANALDDYIRPDLTPWHFTTHGEDKRHCRIEMRAGNRGKNCDDDDKDRAGGDCDFRAQSISDAVAMSTAVNSMACCIYFTSLNTLSLIY
jgi:hypothetical protein